MRARLMLTVPLPRSCPRCRGRLFHTGDVYGEYSSCWGCGFVHEWLRDPALQLPDESDGVRRRRRAPSHGKRAL
jgi:hypothetical protein